MSESLFLEECLALFNLVSLPPKRASDTRMRVLEFLENPVDLTVLTDYSVFIPHPTSLSEIRNKLQQNSPDAYESPVQFVIDFRRVLCNFMRYNFAKPMTPYRTDLRKILMQFEDELEKIYPGMYTAHPHLATLHQAIENSFKIPSASGGVQSFAVNNVFHNVNCYYGPEYHYPSGYLAAVKTPMCVSRILEKLVERGEYQANVGSISIPKKGGKVKARPSTGGAPSFVLYYPNNTTDEVLEDLELIKANILAYDAVTGTNDPIIIADVNAIIKCVREFVADAAAKAEAVTAVAAAPSVAVVNTARGGKSAKNTPAATPVSSPVPAPAPVPAAAAAPKAPKATKAAEPKLTLSMGKKPAAVSSPPAVGTSIAAASSSASAHYATSGTIELGQNSTFVSIALRVIFMESLQEVKKHFMVNKFNQARVPTAGPFLKAVDPLKYPEYALVVTNPIDLGQIEKKIANNRYTAALATVPAGKTTALSSVLSLLSYSDGGAVDPSASTGVVSAGIEAIWAIRCDFELLRSNAHAFNTGPENLEVRLMADALYDIFNYTVLELLTRVGRGSPLHCSSPLSQKWISGTSLATGSSSTRAEQAARYISVFHSLLYTFQAEHSLKVASKQPRASEEHECRDKDGNILVADSRLLRWLETAQRLPESVGTYLGVLEADRVDAERAERERRAALQLKRAAAGPKAAPYVEASYADVVPAPLLPAEPVLAIKTASRKSTGSKGKSAASRVGSPDPFALDQAAMDVDPEEEQEQAILLEVPDQVMRELEPWEVECAAILKRILAHEYVAISKDISREKCICSFFTPVVLDAAKAAAIGGKNPMDLNKLILMVDAGGMVGYDGRVIPRLKDAEDFYRKLISIFSCPILQNEGNEDPTSFGSKVALRARTVARLCKWLCLEKLPLTDAGADKDKKSSSGLYTLDPEEVSVEEADNWDPKALTLTTAARDLHRRFRRDHFLKKYAPVPHETRYSKDCTKLLNALDKACTKLKRDKLIYSWLSVPVQGVSDYAVYIRNPMDIGTIKKRLEAYEHASYQSFIDDLRLVFTNAQTYNSVHAETDTTGVSKEVFEKAIACMNSLEEYVYPIFSVDVADRWGRATLLQDEARLKQQKAEDTERRLKAEAAALYAAEEAKLKLNDAKFAADMDVGRKREQTKKALQEHAEAEQEAQMLIAGGVDEALVESVALQPWKYEHVVGLVTSSKQLSSMRTTEESSTDGQHKEGADSDNTATYFPAAHMLLPQPISAPVAPTGDSAATSTTAATEDVAAAAPSSISMSGTGMFAVIRPNYTRSQEIFMKYQVARHHVRLRAWEMWASRPGMQVGNSSDSSGASVDPESSGAMEVEDASGGDATVATTVQDSEPRVFVEVSNTVAVPEAEDAERKRKHSSIAMKWKPMKQSNAAKPRLNWADEESI